MSVPIRAESGLFSELEKPVSPETAVYRIYDVNDRLLYVGITNDTALRWLDHRRTKSWWETDAHRYDVLWYPSRAVAAVEEKKAIETEQPKHNTMLAVQPLREITPRVPGAYSTGEIAHRFRISPDTIRSLVKAGTFPSQLTDLPSPYRKGKRYAADEVEQYFAHRRPAE